jgi:hypothetical protein
MLYFILPFIYFFSSAGDWTKVSQLLSKLPTSEPQPSLIHVWTYSSHIPATSQSDS